MMRRVLIPLVGIAMCAFVLAEAGEAWARAGGGGSRGSRSYSSPARPDSVSPAMPSSPSRSYGQPAPARFRSSARVSSAGSWGDWPGSRSEDSSAACCSAGWATGSASACWRCS